MNKWFVVFFIAAVVVLAACNTQRKMMCQTWQVTDVTFDSTSRFVPDQQKLFQEEVKRYINLTFFPDSQYIVINRTDTARGKWWIDKKRQVFVTNNPKTGVMEAQILKLNEKNLVYTSKEAGGSVIKFSCIPAEKK